MFPKCHGGTMQHCSKFDNELAKKVNADLAFGQVDYESVERLMKALKITKSTKRVNDSGSGRGRFILQVLLQHPHLLHAVGIELSLQRGVEQLAVLEVLVDQPAFKEWLGHDYSCSVEYFRTTQDIVGDYARPSAQASRMYPDFKNAPAASIVDFSMIVVGLLTIRHSSSGRCTYLEMRRGDLFDARELSSQADIFICETVRFQFQMYLLVSDLRVCR